MASNIGRTDRIVRLVLGVVLIVLPLLGLVGGGWPYWLSLAVGLVLVGTALVRTCPGYALIGISTGRSTRGGRA